MCLFLARLIEADNWLGIEGELSVERAVHSYPKLFFGATNKSYETSRL